ncbi:AMP-binding protein [Micromonospora sp. NPDC049051]|uniref:amino acid adenylation domain-containing protein n=1 Tax=Micromonospora sp. NPDC049051 TaxID=3364264 RepID=UPI00371B3AAB
MMGYDDTRETIGLGPAQWPLYVAAGAALGQRRTVLSVSWGPAAPDLDRVRDLLAQYDACCLALLSMPGLTVPVQRREPGPLGPADTPAQSALRLVDAAQGRRLEISLPAVMVDAVSLRLLWDQLAALLSGRPVDRPELDYLDVAEWQREEAEESSPGAVSAAFRAVLAARDASAQRPAPEHVEHRCGPELLTAARAVPGDLSDVLSAALLLALPAPHADGRRHVANLVPGRGIEALRQVVGRLDLLAPVPVEVPADATVRDLLAAVADARRAAQQEYTRQTVPALLSALTAWQQLAGSGEPLAGVLVEPPFTPLEQPSAAPLTPEVSGFDAGPADLLVRVVEGTADGAVFIRHDRTRPVLAPELLEERLTVILAQFAGADRPVRGLTRTGAQERARLRAVLRGADGTGPGAGDATPVERLILDRADAGPQRIALSAADGELTYGELRDRAYRGAQSLAAAGIGPGSVVAVASGRLVPYVVGCLATRLVGAAFLPIDPTMPSGHRQRLLERAGAAAVLGGPDLAVDAPERTGTGRPHVDIPTGPADAPTPAPDQVPVPLSAPAYVLFTSGSTGVPNPVAVPGTALAGYVRSITRRLSLTADSVAASPAAFTADLGVTALWPVLAAGGRVVEIPLAARLDADRFAGLVAGHGVTLLKITPSHLRALLSAAPAADCLPRDVLVLGGERLDESLVAQARQLRPELTVINHYGPTETTVGVLTAPVTGTDPCPVGTPLPHVTVAVLDDAGEPVPFGHRGELVVGGPALALGYPGDPRLTAWRFRPDPQATHGERVYRTGDVASVDEAGQVWLHGRLDDQIKIRGWRVEPAQSASVLREHPAVRDAAVVAVETAGQVALAGFVVAEAGSTETQLLRYAAEHLPEQLVPTRLHLLDRLPLLPNGKVDRAELVRHAATRATAIVGPRTDLEFVLADVWSELMNGAEIDVTVNLFQAGAHSLMATQALSRLRELLDVDLRIDDLFSHPSVEALAGRLAGGERSADTQRRAALAARVLRMTDEQVDEYLRNGAEAGR